MFKSIRKLRKDKHGEGPSILEIIISISVGLLVAAVLMPVGLSTLANATGMENVDATVIIVLQVLLPILAVISVALAFMHFRTA